LNVPTLPCGVFATQKKAAGQQPASEAAAHAAALSHAFRKRGGQGDRLVFFEAAVQPLVQGHQNGFGTVQPPAEEKEKQVARTCQAELFFG
jgi:hypothetical protein